MVQTAKGAQPIQGVGVPRGEGAGARGEEAGAEAEAEAIAIATELETGVGGKVMMQMVELQDGAGCLWHVGLGDGGSHNRAWKFKFQRECS